LRRTSLEIAPFACAQKRGSGQTPLPANNDTLDPALFCGGDQFDLLCLDDEPRMLSAEHPRMGRAFELEFFAGVDAQEIAQLLGVGLRTIQRDLLANK
jgi:DNA-directed RNA polymerase specialized sigma24 family protein